MIIEVIEDRHFKMLEYFCQRCKILGIENNSSFEAMKLLWCKSWGEYWCAVDDNEIVAVDIVEFAPIKGIEAYDFVVAKLCYEILRKI